MVSSLQKSPGRGFLDLIGNRCRTCLDDGTDDCRLEAKRFAFDSAPQCDLLSFRRSLQLLREPNALQLESTVLPILGFSIVAALDDRPYCLLAAGKARLELREHRDDVTIDRRGIRVSRNCFGTLHFSVEVQGTQGQS